MNISKEYECFEKVMQGCFDQMQGGKGMARHGTPGIPFLLQQTWQIIHECGEGFPLGQAIKKAIESNRLSGEMKIIELRGAVNYLLMALLYLEEENNE